MTLEGRMTLTSLLLLTIDMAHERRAIVDGDRRCSCDSGRRTTGVSLTVTLPPTPAAAVDRTRQTHDRHDHGANSDGYGGCDAQREEARQHRVIFFKQSHHYNIQLLLLIFTSKNISKLLFKRNPLAIMVLILCVITRWRNCKITFE